MVWFTIIIIRFNHCCILCAKYILEKWKWHPIIIHFVIHANIHSQTKIILHAILVWSYQETFVMWYYAAHLQYPVVDGLPFLSCQLSGTHSPFNCLLFVIMNGHGVSYAINKYPQRNVRSVFIGRTRLKE